MDLLAHKDRIMTIDISNTYFSISLSKISRKYTTLFDHKHRCLQFTCCPQGWINSALHLDQLLSILFADIDNVMWVADDTIIATPSDLDYHLDILEKVLHQLVLATSVLNTQKFPSINHAPNS
jgi:hypothetical protein